MLKGAIQKLRKGQKGEGSAEGDFIKQSHNCRYTFVIYDSLRNTWGQYWNVTPRYIGGRGREWQKLALRNFWMASKKWAYIYLFIYTVKDVDIDIWIYIHTYIHMHMPIHIYTHIQGRQNWRGGAGTFCQAKS